MYKITDIQDISRPICKRYVAHIEVAPNTNVYDIKTVIVNATKEICKKYDVVHIVRLYVHMGKNIACQSMWVNDIDDIPLPKHLKYNDSINDIGIVWSDGNVNKI